MKKAFDIGVYSFARKVAGALCPPDDQRTNNGETVAVLHPFQNVDPDGLFCYAVAKTDGAIRALARSNLKLRKVVTLYFEQKPLMTSFEETWAKLTVVANYVAEPKQMELDPG